MPSSMARGGAAPALALAAALLGAPVGAAAQSARHGPRVAGYVQARETFESGVGMTGTINRARVGVEGELFGGFGYKVTAELASPNGTPAHFTPSMRDAFLTWRGGGFTVQAGQFKTPFSGQYLTPLTRVETADRAAVVDALAPKRDVGVMGVCSGGAAGRASVSLGVFNGEGQNVGANRDSSVLVVGRVAVRPVDLLTLAADVARNRDSTRYGVNAGVEYRGWGLKGELLRLHRLGVGRDDWGYYLLATYWLLPDLQLVAEQEEFKRPAVPSFTRNTAFVLGANLWAAGKRVRMLANYVSRDTGARKSELITQVQVVF